MPYSNLPPDSETQGKMERCVAAVQATGKSKQVAIAICYNSITGKKVLLSPYPVGEKFVGDLIPPEGGDPLSWQQVTERGDDWALRQLDRREDAMKTRCSVDGCGAKASQLLTIKGNLLPYCDEHVEGAKDVLSRHKIAVDGVKSAEQIVIDARAQDEKHLDTIQLGYDEKQEHTGSILALKPLPDVAEEIALPHGLTPTELHVTLVYLGETANLDKDEILILAERLAQAVHPFTARLDGVIRFEEGAVALNVNSPYIPEMRQRLVETLQGLGHEIVDIHGFTPHLTVGYDEQDGIEFEPVLPQHEVEFGELWLFWNGEQHSFPMKGLGSKELEFITQEGQVVPIGGPSSGGGSSGASVSFSDAASSGKIDNQKFLDGGINTALLIDYEDDGSGIWKGLSSRESDHNGDSEVVAYQINSLLGGNEVPETVYAKNGYGDIGSSQKFIDGLSEVTLGDIRNANKEQLDRVIALDAIIGNVDRHGSNILKDENGNLVAIDNGLATWGKYSLADVLQSSFVIGALVDKDTTDEHSIWDQYIPRNQNHGSYSFTDSSLSNWRNITRDQFNSAFSGMLSNNIVNPDAGWNNFQKIVEEGKVEW